MDHLNDLPVSQLALAWSLGRIPFQMRIGDPQALALVAKKQQLDDVPGIGATVTVGVRHSPVGEKREAVATEESGAAVGSLIAFQRVSTGITQSCQARAESIENVNLYFLEAENVDAHLLSMTNQRGDS